MGEPSEVIDLTNSFTLADLPANLIRAVIEINDTPYQSPAPPRSPGRRQRTRRPTASAQCSVDVVDTPVENFVTPVPRRRKPRTSRNVPEATQNIPNGEVVRERSPLDKGKAACAICLETFTSQRLCSTKCGHVFCEECLQQSLRRDKKCPTCRKSLRGRDAFHPIYL